VTRRERRVSDHSALAIEERDLDFNATPPDNSDGITRLAWQQRRTGGIGRRCGAGAGGPAAPEGSVLRTHGLLYHG
jgi:hypothetical protein